jgi:hypothetical protein
LIENLFLPENEEFKERCIKTVNEALNQGKIDKGELFDKLEVIENGKSYKKDKKDNRWVDSDKIMQQFGTKIDIKCLIILLLKESESLNMISKEAIKSFLDCINREEKNIQKQSLPSPAKKLTHSKFDEYKNSEKQREENMKATPNDLQVNKDFFIRLADFMFTNDLTLYQIIHTKIYVIEIQGFLLSLLFFDRLWQKNVKF